MPAPSGPGKKGNKKLHAGHASFDSDFRLEWSSEGFDRLVGSHVRGSALQDVLPVFRGVEDTLRGMAATEQPEWYLPAVAHPRPGQHETSFLDIMAFTDDPGAALTIFVWDVTIEMQVRGRLMQERNEMWLLNKRLNLGGMRNDLARHHTETALIDISDQIELMVAWVDRHMTIRAATPNFTAYLQRSLVDAPLFMAIPTLLGLEAELVQIAEQQAPAWRIPGFRLIENRSQLCDLLFLPWTDGNGLYVAARVMSLETSIEQALRQQRNELTLIERKLEAQTATLKMARDRLVNLDHERAALVNLIANDVRSALSVIQGYSEWLDMNLRSSGEAGQQAAVEAIEQSVHKVKALIEDVQAIQRVEQALAHMQTSSFDLSVAIAETVAMWRDTAALQGLVIDDVQAQTPVIFVGDSGLIKEAISSMIRCAIAQAARPSRLRLSVARGREWLVLRAAFTPAKALAAKPRQKPISDTMEIQLARARLVAEGHEGYLAVESAAAEEQSISIWLPDESGGSPNGFSEALIGSDDTANARQASTGVMLSPITAGDGAVLIDRRYNQVWVDDQLVNLSGGEFRLLLRLAEEAGQMVRHEQLLEAIQQSGAEASLESLRVLIWRLRNKLGVSPTGVEYLQTVRGFGYVLIE